MMYNAGIKMEISVPKTELLEALKKNRDDHKKNYEEAREGYCSKALKEVEEKIQVLKEGKPVLLAFSFQPPQDMTSVYNTTIKMLEWTPDNVVQLDASEFRKLVEDEWDWSAGWFSQNARWSSSVAASGSIKGYY